MRCGLVGAAVLLGMGFEVSKAHAMSSLCLSLLTDHYVALSYFPSTTPAYHHVPCHGDNGLSL